jgi:hypothetical protein
LRIFKLGLSSDGMVLYAGTGGVGVLRLGPSTGGPPLASATAELGPEVPADTPSEAAPTSVPESSRGGGICAGAAALHEELLQNAVAMTATAQLEGDAVVVRVEITNDQTGHHVPTDSPLRHLILLVQAANADGNPLTQLEGPTVPVWGGIGDPARDTTLASPGRPMPRCWRNSGPRSHPQPPIGTRPAS